jgi:membrane associated rhomboid family serine protease
MGIYDREYYRHEGPSFLRAFAGRGQVCKWLIAVNVVCFLVQLIDSRGTFTETFWLTEGDVLSGQVWRLLTYAFLHDPGAVLHIVFNMLFLWWFGSDMEDLYGPREFLAFYLTSAAAGGVAYVAWQAARGAADAPCLGASGAVTAALVLSALHYPMRKIYLWLVLPIPIWAFVAFQVAQDTLIFISNTRTTTAVAVHLAGALFAFLYYKQHWRLLNLLPNLRSWQRQHGRARLRVFREEPYREPLSVGAAPDGDEQLGAKVDAVLEKVAKHGQGSLTDGEREILLRASEVYKRRRS